MAFDAYPSKAPSDGGRPRLAGLPSRHKARLRQSPPNTKTPSLRLGSLVLAQRGEQALEHGFAVGAAVVGFADTLGVWHQAEHGAAFVEDPGDVAH